MPNAKTRKQAKHALKLDLIPTGLAVLLSVLGVATAGETRLIDAVKSGNAAAVQQLLRQKVPVNDSEPDGSTALHWAVRADRIELVQALIRAGAQADVATRYGLTPLSLAAVNGSAPAVKLLLEAGARPNAAGPDGETALMLASRTGKPAAVQLLVDAGADVNARERWQGETALMWAAAENMEGRQRCWLRAAPT